VHRALYLLFNEGYHGASAESAVREELCREAMRLVVLLLEHPYGTTPASYALAALMCLHAAPLPTRVDASGHLSPLYDQDRSQWDRSLIGEGLRLMAQSATGPELSEYHLESAIAAMHAKAPRLENTDWKVIVSLYDLLISLRPSPIIALNRAIAISQREGPERGIDEISHIADLERLTVMHIHSIQLRWANSSSCAATERSLVSISPPHALSRVIRWNVNSSSAGFQRVEHAPHANVWLRWPPSDISE
jgi:RNA polymerase sigma-70 factor (ECF subfamily)